MSLRVLLLTAAGLLAACASDPARPLTDPPQACASGFEKLAPLFTLPPAMMPADAAPQKGAPLKYANAFPIGGKLGDLGRWSQGRSGWTAWRLRLQSEGARGLSVHVKPFDLPDDAHFWLCAPDGRRQGPYGKEQLTDFWSPQLASSELWLELQVPAAQQSAVNFTLAEVYAAYR